MAPATVRLQIPGRISVEQGTQSVILSNLTVAFVITPPLPPKGNHQLKTACPNVCSFVP